MIIPASTRLNTVSEYYFSTKLKEVATRIAAGKPVVNLGIGSPDLAPPKTVLDTIEIAIKDTKKHSYQSYRGLPEFRQAIASFYKKYYTVSLDTESEILPLMGSKEGIMHISMAFLNAGDEVLVPNPGYITYGSATKLVGAKPIYYQLDEKNDWLPDFEALEKLDLSKVKLMWLNYPNMPTGSKGNVDLFKRLITFAKKHKILLINDNPYSFVLNDKPLSILAISGAKEVALELNSLSKTFNMAGWRVGMLLGASKYITKVLQVKSNMDSGMFYGIQQGAIKALQLDNNWFENQNTIYAKRREIVWKILDELACVYTKDSVGLFVWAKLPEHVESVAFCDDLLYIKDVFITPGSIFGSAGEQYIRLSLCVPEEQLNEVLKRVSK